MLMSTGLLRIFSQMCLMYYDSMALRKRNLDRSMKCAEQDC